MVRRGAGPRLRRGQGTDFGVAFSVFLSAWIATELISIFAPATWSDADEILHFAVLLAFAAWTNVRWRWALRRGREAP